MISNNGYEKNSYQEYLQSIQNKVYKSNYIGKGGISYYAYGLRLINKTSTNNYLTEDSMVCISMNHTKLYDQTCTNNTVLNLIPISKLRSGDFILTDYKYPNTEVIIQANRNAKYIGDQYMNRPVKQIKSFRTTNDTVKSNIENEYTDLTLNRFNVIRFEHFKEVYSMDIENPQLIVFTSIEDAYSGNHSFTKMVDFDRNTNSYVYINYQYQNRLEKIEEVDKYFKISEYNQKVLDTFGTDNLKWEI